MGEKELQVQLVNMVRSILSEETEEVRTLVLFLLNVTKQKAKNIQVEVTAKSALEDYFKKSIQDGTLDIDDIDDIDLSSLGM